MPDAGGVLCCCWLSEAGDATEWDEHNGEIHAQSNTCPECLRLRDHDKATSRVVVAVCYRKAAVGREHPQVLAELTAAAIGSASITA